MTLFITQFLEAHNMKRTNSLTRHCQPARILIMSILLTGILFGIFGWSGHAYAEGSRTLYPAGYPAGGYRADLDLQPGTAGAPNKYVGKVRRSGFLYVYANAGEYIVLGSRNRSNNGDIYVYNPQDFGVPGDEIYNSVTPGTPDFTCSGGSSQPGPHYFGGTSGTISTRAQELAGPNSADNTVTVTNGFQPCAYRAPVTGSYGVLFFGATGTNPPVYNNPDGSIATPILESLGVSAWDVTVRANRTSTTDINGRLYTYAFIGFTGGNERPVYYSLFYVTRDGYRYQQYLNGLDGNGYALYANSLGFLDNGQPLYKDLRGNEALVSTLPLGVTTQTAEYPIFFNDASPSGVNATEVNRVLSALNIPLAPTAAIVTNVNFIGNVAGSTTYLGTGGTFTFDTTNTITYQIVISLDGIDFDPSNVNNATLTGLAPSGSNVVIWNGMNNSNVNFPAGGPYSFQVYGRNGESHFPIIDAENNYYGGPEITRLNGVGSPDKKVYYDDRGYVLSTGLIVGTLNGYLCPTATPAQPAPAYSLAGTNSSTAYRTWGVNAGTNNTNADCTSTNAWGDAKAVNLWTYFSSTPALKTLNVISVNVDVASSVTGPITANAGNTVQGTFRFVNNGTAIAHGVTYTMSLSPGLGTVTFGNLPPGTTATYNNVTGAVTFGGTPLPTTLLSGQSVLGTTPTAPMTYSYTAPASGSVTVSTNITTSDTDGVPSNNSDSITTYIGTVDVQTSINVLAIAAPYSTVTGNIQFTNNGTSAATGLTYTATIGDSNYYPPFISFTSVPTGITPSYDNTTGVITFTGLPSTLGSSETFNIGFSYPAPGSGIIPVTSAITTTSIDANPANNTSNDSTYVGADLTIAKSHTGNFYRGQNGVQYTISVSNIGSTATSGTVTVTDTLPAGLTATAISGTGWTCVLGTLTCTRSDALASGVSYPAIALTVNVSGTAGSPLVNSVTVSGGGDVNSGNNTDTDSTIVLTSAAPVLQVTKTHSGNFYQGQTGAQYTITVSNIGATATSGTVTVTDTLPTRMTATAISGTGWTCVLGTLTCTRSDALAPGANYPIITLTVNVAANAQALKTNSVTASGGGGGTSTATDPTTVTPSTTPVPDLTITKTHTGNFTQGQIGAQYTITVSNVGQTATNGTTVTVTDTLPAGLTATAISGTGWTCVLGTLTCTRSNVLNNGGTSYPAITLTVNVWPNATTPLVNTVTVNGGGDTYTGNNTATDSTVINQLPDLTVTKTHTGNFYQGQTGAQYTITVSNTGGAVTSGTVTVTDTLPVGLTATAISGTGWACVLGTLTCTRSDALAAGASYPAIILTVNVAAGAGSPLTNSVTASGGGGGTSTATDPTTVSINAPDLTTTKTHTTVFYRGATGSTYTITVTNSGNGTKSAGNTVTVTDTLPTGLTATAISGTGWACVLGTLTCTRSDALAAGASYPAITLTVDVASDAPYTLTNTANVSLTGQSESDTNNNIAQDTTTITPTLAIIAGFRSSVINGRVVVEWETASEHNTLGFYLLRLEPATREYRSVTEGLLPGLITEPGGGVYSLVDREASVGKTYRYKLVEVERNGRQISYGPFEVTAMEQNITPSSAINISSSRSLSKENSYQNADYTRRTKQLSAVQETLIQARTMSGESAKQNNLSLAKGSRGKIPVQENGLYYMDAGNISAATGTSIAKVKTSIGSNLLSVSNKGQSIAYLPAQGNAGIYFYAVGIDSAYTRDNVYWIDTGKGITMSIDKTTASVFSGPDAVFTDTLHIEKDLIQNMGQTDNPAEDYWNWDLIFLSTDYSNGPKDFTFSLDGKADTQSLATLQVHLVGGSDIGINPDHHVVVSLNGQQIKEGWWGGLNPYTLTATFNQSLINEGQNTIEVKGVLDTGIPWSMFLIDSFDLTYERRYEAVDNKLFFTGNGNQTVTVRGFTTPTPDIVLLNITDPRMPKVNTSGTIKGSPGSYEISFRPASPDAHYLAVARDAAMKADNALGVNPSNLKTRVNTADYLVIVPGELEAAVQPLAAYRKTQGLKTMVVKLDDIMNEFNFGISSPEAIKQFLSHAYKNWIIPPKYVVLAGVGTWDYKDNKGKGGNLIPPALVPTSYGLSTSDNYFADVNGDHVPEMAIGRLPVLTPEELQTLIAKIKKFEATAGNRVILVADDPDDGGKFPVDSQIIAALFPSRYLPLEKVYLGEYSSVGAARTTLLDYLNSGAVFFNYIGHGSFDTLAMLDDEDLLTSDDMASLTNRTNLPIVTAMTCLAGEFAIPGYPTISQVMLLNTGGGAAAFWSATGLSDNAQAHILNREFYKAIFNSGKKVLGDAVLQALEQYRMTGYLPFMMDIYTILGDPALRIK
jgi:uncharacterized repeat protein (TIGR01451 family)